MLTTAPHAQDQSSLLATELLLEANILTKSSYNQLIKERVKGFFPNLTVTETTLIVKTTLLKRKSPPIAKKYIILTITTILV